MIVIYSEKEIIKLYKIYIDWPDGRCDLYIQKRIDGREWKSKGHLKGTKHIKIAWSYLLGPSLQSLPRINLGNEEQLVLWFDNLYFEQIN